ncbi:hypothetical protein TNCV_4962381 [Trichonephila clavipes]|nr:hypothetical protein TNCV_4962381 [Trichonephila clavipes]
MAYKIAPLRPIPKLAPQHSDSGDENEVKKAAPVPTSSEMWNIMKSMRSNLDAPSNGEMNTKMDDIEQFDAKKGTGKENNRLFSKNSINVCFSKNLKILC